MKYPLRRFILFILIVGVFFIPYTIVLAQEEPVSDNLCWTVEECEERITSTVVRGSKPEKMHTWASELFQEKPDQCKLLNTGYCYAPSISYNLLIPFGEIKTVKGIGGYVQALYALSIALSAIGVVLTITIAGLMWMVARGDTGQVSKAKEMIQKGLVSVIILLFVVMLANLIDPKLTIVNSLRTPLVKQVNFIPEGSACEVLVTQYGYTITPQAGTVCGNKGTITGIPEDLEIGGASVVGAKEGDTCYYRRCANGGTCILPPGKQEYTCMQCADYAEDTNSPASASVCRQFKAGMKLTEEQYYKCEYFPPESIFGRLAEFTNVAESGFCAEIVYPQNADPIIDCQRLRDAKTGCSAYENIGVITASGEKILSDLSARNVKHATDLLKQFCNEDICHVSLNGCQSEIEQLTGGLGVPNSSVQIGVVHCVSK